MEKIIELDEEFFLYLHNLGTDNWDNFWLTITHPNTWIPFYIFFVILCWVQFGWKRMLLIVVTMSLIILCSDQFTNLLKHSIERFRPCRDEDLYPLMRAPKEGFPCGGRYGFTSAHASNHFAYAVFIGLVFWQKKHYILYLLLIWAAMIAYSRIYVGVHFPLDIFFGSLVGISFALLFWKLYLYILRKYPSTFG